MDYFHSIDKILGEYKWRIKYGTSTTYSRTIRKEMVRR